MENPTTKLIRDRALAARISIRELQRLAGVANNTVWRWENVVGEPSPLTLARVNDALDMVEAGRAA